MPPTGGWSEKTAEQVTLLARAEAEGVMGAVSAQVPASPEDEKFALQRERLLRMSQAARAEARAAAPAQVALA